MVTFLLISAAVIVLVGTLYLGAYLGYRTGFRDGRRSARATTEARWVELLELSMNTSRSRAAHPSRSSGAHTDES